MFLLRMQIRLYFNKICDNYEYLLTWTSLLWTFKMYRLGNFCYIRSMTNIQLLVLFGLWCLTPLSTIFQLYRGRHFHWWRKLKYPNIYFAYLIRVHRKVINGNTINTDVIEDTIENVNSEACFYFFSENTAVVLYSFNNRQQKYLSHKTCGKGQ